ncbi:MAG: M23 family metallopeptidase [Lachnospiraceae bacterium]|nr:M23 family metallopeptidase [Lachnospiraceae bacterium]
MLEGQKLENLKVKDFDMEEFKINVTKMGEPKFGKRKQNCEKIQNRIHHSKKFYTFMILTNGSEEKTRKIRISSKSLDLVIAVFLVVLAVATYGLTHAPGAVTASSGSSQEIVKLTNENLELTQQNTELTNKVAILSDTINQKIEEENAKKQENAEKCMPTGFPLSGTASMTEANANEAAGPGAPKVPMVIFDSSAGTNVITTGDGTVSYVGVDDTDYGNMIKVDHGNGYISVYRNVATPRVSEGDEIPRGTVLFQMDETSTRLGYEIIKEDQAVDPLTLLEIAG